MSVFLSASIPLPHRPDPYGYRHTADVISIKEAVKSLVLVIIERKGRLVFGGHPAITPLVRMLFNQAGRPPSQAVILYQSKYFRKDFPPDNAEFERVHLTEAVPGNEAESLRLMRRAMLQEPVTCGVFIGGLRGVIDEFEMFREMHPKAPTFPVASTGAASRQLFRDYGKFDRGLMHDFTYPTLFRRLLKNLDLGQA